MMSEPKHSDFKSLLGLLNRVYQNPFSRVIRLFSAIMFIPVALFSIAYFAFSESDNISKNLTDDFSKVAEAQAELLNDIELLFQSLSDPNVSLDLRKEASDLQEFARVTIGALGAFRSPSNPINSAVGDYTRALERLMGVASRIQRGETVDIARQLVNASQDVANTAGELRIKVQKFQGSVWIKTWRSLF